VELGFADGILYADDDADSGGAGNGSGGAVTEDSVMFSRRAVNNALVNKLEAKYGKAKVPVEKQTEIHGSAAGDNGGYGAAAGRASIDMSCTGATGNVQNLHVGSGEVNKVTGQNDSGLDNGRSADELRERLNFIKKFI
jgi:ATP-dependent Clp protease protease subunit